MPPLRGKRSAERRVVSLLARRAGAQESMIEEGNNSQSPSRLRLRRHQADGASERMTMLETRLDVPPNPILPITILVPTSVLRRGEYFDEVEAYEGGSERSGEVCSAT